MRWARTSAGWAHDMECDDWLEVVPEGDGWLLLRTRLGREARISTHDTESKAKCAACEWVQGRIAKLSNGLAEGCITVDDGE